MKSVVVFFGGKSVEHDVSVITGVMTLNSIDKEKYSPVPIYVDKKGEWYTGDILKDPDEYNNLNYKKLSRVTLVGGSNVLYRIKNNRLKPIDSVAVAINCMHGGSGEDGSFAGLLKSCGIPLASPPILPSAVSMDKRFTKTVMSGLKVKTLPFVFAKKESDAETAEKNLQYPMIVKPNLLGSSIGVMRAKDKGQLVAAIRYALRFGSGAIIEPCLEDFVEINCAAYLSGNKEITVSECERPVGRDKILTFGDKYEDGKRVFPADIDKKLSDKIKQTTEKIYRELDFRGVIRIDYFISGGVVYLNEINAVPGSLSYYLFSKTLKGFTVMLSDIRALAEKEFAVSSTFKTDYKSGILSGVGSKGAKRL